MKRQNIIKALPLLILIYSVGVFSATNFLTAPSQAKANQNQTQSNGGPLPLLFVDPQNGTANVGDYYTIYVKLVNVTNLYGLDVGFAWGSSVLQYFEHQYIIPYWDYGGGGVLNDPVQILIDNVDSNAGTYRLTALSTPPADPWIDYGFGGIVFRMTFRVKNAGETYLYLTHSTLVNDEAGDIDHETQDGYFYMPGLGSVPVADFTYSPTTSVINRTAITFNASNSYDPDGGIIALYMWDFGDGNKTNTSSPAIKHTYSKPGVQLFWEFTVKLSVVDVEGSQSQKASQTVRVEYPNPVAEFTTWPPPDAKGEVYAVLNKNITFDGSASYDPDFKAGNLSAGIVEYTWDWATWKEGDINVTVTDQPITSRSYSFKRDDGFVVTLQVKDTEGRSSSLFNVGKIFVVDARDTEVTSVQVSPSQLSRGLNATISTTITNIGNATENFKATAYFNQTPVGVGTQWIKVAEKNVTRLQKQQNVTLTFTWNTKDVASNCYYHIKVNTTEVPHETDHSNNAKISSTAIYVKEARPVAAFDHSPKVPMPDEEIVFDASLSHDLDGNITLYRWDFGDGVERIYTGANITATTVHTYGFPDVYKVTFTVVDNDGLNSSLTKWIKVATYYPLEVTIDAGTIHFGGEVAEFYILVLRSGQRINASKITAVLYYSNGTLHRDLSSDKQQIETGFYRIVYNLPSNAPPGTYTILVEARQLDLQGTAIKSFLVSQTLEGWDALLIDIKEEIATIVIPNLAHIKANLTQIKATLVRIEGTLGIVNSTLGEMVVPDLATINATLVDVRNMIGTVNSTLGQLKTSLIDINATLTDLVIDSEGTILARVEYFLGTTGKITVKLQDINAFVEEIDGSVLTVASDVGKVMTATSGVQAATATPLYVAAVFSTLAAIGSIVIVLLLRKPASKP